MTAKEYLGQAYRLDQRINSKLQQVDSLRSLTQKITASYDGEVVSHTRNVTSLQDTIIRLMEAEEELNRQIDELVDLKMDIARQDGQSDLGLVRVHDYDQVRQAEPPFRTRHEL